MAAVDELLALPRFGTGLGLHRVLHAVESLDVGWWYGLDALKITGSNGKGSTATMVAAILGALGLRVGLHTSPHLLRVHERIAIGGRPIGEEALQASATRVLARIRDYERRYPGDRFGAFEAMTVVALDAMAQAQVEIVVAEAGIGGRYDPTRVIPGQICGLVSVDREHTALLGETEEAIMLDKADLCPYGGHLVVGPLAPELLRRLEAYAALRTMTLEPVDAAMSTTIHEQTLAGTRFSMALDEPLVDDGWLPVAGRHQLHNLAVAVTLVRRWLARNRPEIELPRQREAIERALASLRLLGRLQKILDDPPLWVDLAHTPAAMQHLVDSLRGSPGLAPILLVTGVSRDRDPAALLAPILPLAREIIVTRAHHRGAEVSTIDPVIGQLAPQTPQRTIPVLEDAIVEAVDRARARSMAIVVAGGLFLAAEAMAVVRDGVARRPSSR